MSNTFDFKTMAEQNLKTTPVTEGRTEGQKEKHTYRGTSFHYSQKALLQEKF